MGSISVVVSHLLCKCGFINVVLILIRKLSVKNITPTPMELKILELPPRVCSIDSSPMKRKVDSCLSPPKKKSRRIPPARIRQHLGSFQSVCLIKSPRRANVAKRPKSPLPKRWQKHANVPSYTCIKQNVEIKSKVTYKCYFCRSIQEPSQHLPSIESLTAFNDLNDQEQDLLNAHDQTKRWKRRIIDTNKADHPMSIS
ncbi:hypothetical protein H5410_001089 [Solanum commersonii]|uniref:Uncharacterized protein n=1 Tax=Solanum commersonii TaxID=4109 RepID=A0A9J6AY47_SOLCO|nr:hypothetical protein H5410_001089 [Solanum commersonii]